MQYRVIGLMSGSSLDGLDIVFAEFTEQSGSWSFEIVASACYPYDGSWRSRLSAATTLSAVDYQLLHTDYGRYLGTQVNRFIDEKNLHYKVALVSSHGHTTFHLPQQGMTAQLGDGAALAAATELPVVSDLRALDVAFGGQGAPIVPIGEKLLFASYPLFLNLGGIANISIQQEPYTAFDVCPANRVLDLLAQTEGMEYDRNGDLSRSGAVKEELLEALNMLDYYKLPSPKSLANSFGVEEVMPLIKSYGFSTRDALRTYCEHVAEQVKNALTPFASGLGNGQLLVTGGGAFNSFLMERIQEKLNALNVSLVKPSDEIIAYKEALIMGLIGVLRWRQEYNVLSTVTGASRNSIGGAVWIGQEA